MKKRIYKNPITGKTYLSESACISSLEKDNSKELESMKITAKQAIFNSRNKLPITNLYGQSVISKKPTVWNEKAGRYQRFTDDTERAQYRQTFLDRMRKVHGKDHLLSDPNQQRFMLANRGISGEYTFQDGTHKTYTGKEELALLKFFNEVLEWPSSDIITPAPQNFHYEDPDGKEHFYFPDAWIESLNLILEVKGELHSYRLRDIETENRKDEILKTSKYEYFKVEDRNYLELLNEIVRIKEIN
jgi:hypothetical protein